MKRDTEYLLKYKKWKAERTNEINNEREMKGERMNKQKRMCKEMMKKKEYKI